MVWRRPRSPTVAARGCPLTPAAHPLSLRRPKRLASRTHAARLVTIRARTAEIACRSHDPEQTCTTVVHMTVRLSVSLPDEVHAGLLRIAEGSHISAAAVVRAVLSDVVPKMTGILDFLGTVTPETAKEAGADLDVWADQMRTLLHDAPPVLGPFRNALDDPPAGGDES